MYLPRSRRRSQRSQLQGDVVLDGNNPLTEGLLLALYMRGEDAWVAPRDYVTGRMGVTTPITTWTDTRGVSPRFDGTGGCASFAIDLSAYKQITLSFLMYWDANVANNDLAFEYGSNFSFDDGFVVDPNWTGGSTPSFLAAVGSSQSNPIERSAGQWFACPTAAMWHYYQILFDRDNTTIGVSGSPGGVIIDNIAQPPNSTNFAFNVSYFGNNTLHIMSRNANTWFGAGKLQCVTIHGGHLTAEQLWEQSRDPYQIVKPVDRAPYIITPRPPTQPVIWMSP